MVTILSIYICLHSICKEVVVPTPISYECGQMQVEGLEAYLEAIYPHWQYKGYACNAGRYA